MDGVPRTGHGRVSIEKREATKRGKRQLIPHGTTIIQNHIHQNWASQEIRNFSALRQEN